jgi:hypothetical protein
MNSETRPPSTTPWWKEMLSIGRRRSHIGRFTELCGYVYVSSGLIVCFLPELQRMLVAMAAFQTPRETGLFRLFGLFAVFIGWFYVLAGRAESRPLILGTLVDRWLVLPFVGYLYTLQQLDLGLALSLGVGDAVLAAIAILLFRRQQAHTAGSGARENALG